MIGFKQNESVFSNDQFGIDLINYDSYRLNLET